MKLPRFLQPNNKDCTRRVFWLCVAAVVAVRLFACGFQMVYTWVGGAPLDDELMFRAAQAISSGQWLGPYDYLTLSKSMFFAVWLALLNLLHIPYLLGGQALWLAASLLAAQAFAPVLRRYRSRLVLFALLAFNPAVCSAYSLRVYRDNIFPALCLLFFAGFAGCALRAAKPESGRLWPWLVAAGVGFGTAWLTREDAGLFLLPFALVGSGIIVAVLVRAKRPAASLQLLIPYGMLAAALLLVCQLNQAYYGVFTLSDFSSGSYADAIGAMTRVAMAQDTIQYVTIPAQTRTLLYDKVEALQPLEYWLEEDAQMQNDFRDPKLKDYRAGSFYWAIRRAAQFEGIYADAATADAYWAGVAQQINALCDAGELPGGAKRSGTTPPVTASAVAPTLAEAAKSAVWALTFQNCPPYEAARSIGTVEDFALWNGYLHCNTNGAAEAGKDTPYYSPTQKMMYGAMQGGRYLYAVLLPIVFVYALYINIIKIRFVFARLKKCKETTQPETQPSEVLSRVLWWLLFGFLMMAAYRCAMIAFVETSSFGIGTSTMYLATVHPLLLLYAGVSLLAHWADKPSDKGEPNEAV